MSTETPQTQAQPPAPHHVEQPEVVLYSHSHLLYWWPVWAAGYIMALITWFKHVEVQVGGNIAYVHPSSNLGIIYSLVVLVVVLLTITHIRGRSSVIVVLAIAFIALLFTYMDWWTTILQWLGKTSIYLNMGFYLFFSTLLFVIWCLTIFVFDRLSYWRVRPGQVTHEFLLGASDKSYDTDAMVLTKRQDDIFRHLILGVGSGDLHMQTMGGTGQEAVVPNVCFVSRKIAAVERLIATKPDLPQQA